VLFAVEEERGAEPTIFQPKRIELGVAAYEYDWNLPTMRPAQNSADAPRTAGEASCIENDEIEARGWAAEDRLECGGGRA
jgi:hypothetical protein